MAPARLGVACSALRWAAGGALAGRSLARHAGQRSQKEARARASGDPLGNRPTDAPAFALRRSARPAQRRSGAARPIAPP
ncbi:MAG: hypothetical protein J3K34DRAFT_412016 [Monoraphidium minutum]|nr:MAG: hypothetical protein J3K34DRAFT_412016 [Monoraphidium minutum]